MGGHEEGRLLRRRGSGRKTRDTAWGRVKGSGCRGRRRGLSPMRLKGLLGVGVGVGVGLGTAGGGMVEQED